jgi:hypothetical protein
MWKDLMAYFDGLSVSAKSSFSLMLYPCDDDSMSWAKLGSSKYLLYSSASFVAFLASFFLF